MNRCIQTHWTTVLAMLSLAVFSAIGDENCVYAQDPAVALGDAIVVEGDPPATVDAVFTVTLDAPTVLETRLDYATIDYEALAGIDYEATSGTLMIPAGETSATISVPVIGDELQETAERFAVELSNPVNAILVDALGEAVITDDDVPAVAVTKTDALVSDPGGDGEANPGDVVSYQIAVSNPGSGLLSGVELADPIPVHTQVVAGSVSASQGTVTGEEPVAVALGDLAPGASATVSFEVAIASPLPLGLEQVANQATVTSVELAAAVSDDPETPEPDDPTVTPVVSDPEIVASKSDALVDDADGDAQVSPGDTLRYTIGVDNVGAGAATGVVLRDLIPENTALVAGSVIASAGTIVTEDPVEIDLGILDAAASVTVAFDVTIVHPFPLGVDDVANQGTVTSDQLPAVLTDDPDVGGDADPTVTMVTAMPRLLAEKSDALAIDADGDGEPSPGDTVAYTLTLGNLGNTAATGVELVDLIPAHTTLVPGSVTASAGSVVSEDPVEVSVGLLEVGDEVTIGFQVQIINTIPVGVAEVVNQGVAAADGLDDTLTDDPDVGGDADPTVTAITAEPVLVVEKTDVLFADADGDTLVSPGDELLYRIEVENLGNTGATGVVLRDPLPLHTTLVPGTVQTSQGTVVAEDPVEVSLGQVDVGTPAVVTFRVRIDDPFPWEATEVANKASVESAELETEPSDDPDTGAEGDATATEVFITPGIAIDDVVVSEGDPGTSADAVFAVSLTEPGNRPVTVNYQTADGSAANGLDYETASGSVTFAPGETSLTVAVSVLPDLIDEPDETLAMILADAEGGTVADAEGAGTILDDDPPPAVSIAGVVVAEGDAGSTDAIFAVTLSAPSGFDVTVDYQTADDTAIAGVDYQAVAGSLLIPAGSLVAAVAVPVLGDVMDEPDETFFVQLTGAVYGVLVVPLAAGTILDDDPPICLDADEDGYGSPGDASCPSGTADDCDDSNAAINPGAIEVCDGIDNNCDGEADEGIDADGDEIPDCFDDCPFDADDDADGDGVCGNLDVCAETLIPEGVPTVRLGVNRYALVDDDFVFDTKAPGGKGGGSDSDSGSDSEEDSDNEGDSDSDGGNAVIFTIEDAGGCSCEQIIEELNLGRGHVKFGCSLGAMREWTNLIDAALNSIFIGGFESGDLLDWSSQVDW